MGKKEHSSWTARVWQRLWRAALFVFFATVLMIPRLRRLRRHVWLWQGIRLGALLIGGFALWRFVWDDGGVATLLLGILLLPLGLLVGPERLETSVDEQARALGALVVLNGGAFIPPGNGQTTRGVRIYVHPERLHVLDARHQPLAEIPLARVRHLAAGARTGAGRGEEWELQIAWDAGTVETAAFRFDGFFAEHLARVAETTIRTVLKKELRVFGA